VVYSGGDLDPVTIIRTIDQIRESWKKSKTWTPGKKGTFHEDTPDLAVRRTVIRRACLEIINSSDDFDLILTRAVREADQVAQEIALDAEIEENANGELLTLEGDYRQPTQPGQSGPLESAYEDQDPGGPGSPPADEPPVTANPKGGQARLEPDF